MAGPQFFTPPSVTPSRPKRRFTLEQANKTLPLVSRIVNDIVKAHFPVSAELGGLAMLLSMLVGIPLGIGLLNNDIDCLDDDATALWQGVPRIHNQVENCRLELRTIYVAWVEPRIELQAQLDLRTGGMTHERFKFQQHAIEIEGYRPHHLAAREHQELFDQTLAALCGLEGRLGDTRNAVAVGGL